MTKTTKQRQVTTSRKTAIPETALRNLSSLEENVLRMRHGVTVPGAATLETKAATAELAEKLYAIEARAYEMTGRAAARRAKRSSPKAKIVQALKAKA